MTHVSIQVRDKIAALLTAGVAAVDERVFAGRADPFDTDEMPAIAVGVARTAPRTDGKSSGGPGLQHRVLTVPITILHVLTDDVEAALYEIAIAVEGAIFAAGAFADLKIAGFEFAGDQGISAVPAATENGILAGLTLNFNVTVVTREGAADTSLIRG